MDKEPINLRVGRALKYLISEYYDSQEQFAFDFGLELRTVSRYVNQGINKLDLLQQIAEHFNVDISFFITFEE